MSFRTFTDAHGVEWTAWDVVPGALDRRIADRRLLSEPVASERRGGRRRLCASGPTALTCIFAHGWLCFETHSERRRLIPIPEDWPTCAEQRLVEYCLHAKPVPRR